MSQAYVGSATEQGVVLNDVGYEGTIACVNKTNKKQCTKDKMCQWNDDKTCSDKAAQLETVCADIKNKKECKQTGGCKWNGNNGCVDPDVVPASMMNGFEEPVEIKSSSDLPIPTTYAILVGIFLVLWN